MLEVQVQDFVCLGRRPEHAFALVISPLHHDAVVLAVHQYEAQVTVVAEHALRSLDSCLPILIDFSLHCELATNLIVDHVQLAECFPEYHLHFTLLFHLDFVATGLLIRLFLICF